MKIKGLSAAAPPIFVTTEIELIYTNMIMFISIRQAANSFISICRITYPRDLTCTSIGVFTNIDFLMLFDWVFDKLQHYKNLVYFYLSQALPWQHQQIV